MKYWMDEIAKHYNITPEQARARYLKVVEQEDNPSDPICVGCALRPEELDCYTSIWDPADYDSVTEYVINEEGTYNASNGHFLCDACYIINGQPATRTGWRAP